MATSGERVETAVGSRDSDTDANVLFSAYAVSGVDAPGLKPSVDMDTDGSMTKSVGESSADSVMGGATRSDAARRHSVGPLTAIDCVDGLGECYLRNHDAEFKLACELCMQHLGLRGPSDVNAQYEGRITLWSKKPLCASCSDVFHTQLAQVLPSATLEVRVDDDDVVDDDQIVGVQ